MAIEVPMENEYGFDVTYCYIRVEKFSGDKTGIDLDLLVYATVNARVDGKRPLKRDRVRIPYPTQGVRNFMEYCYEEVKKLPQYTFSKDI